MKNEYDIALSFAMANKDLVEKVFHYLQAEGFTVFFAPSQKGQMEFSGKNQDTAFYEIFGIKARYVALFISKDYIKRTATMHEASIAFAKHKEDGSVISIYLDDTELPKEFLDPQKINYFKSNSAPQIAAHLSGRIKKAKKKKDSCKNKGDIFNVKNNVAQNQIFIKGDFKL